MANFYDESLPYDENQTYDGTTLVVVPTDILYIVDEPADRKREEERKKRLRKAHIAMNKKRSLLIALEMLWG